MIHVEKMRIISENLRMSDVLSEKSYSIVEGSVLELALEAAENYDEDEAVSFARNIIPDTDFDKIALFCKLYTKYKKNVALAFIEEEFAADKPRGVIIPEIPRLEGAVDVLRRFGLDLEREYGESFAHCAGDVEGGRNRYALFPIKSPEEGRLRAFDSLRDRYGLSVHAVVNVIGDDEGEYAYELCAVGFSHTPSQKNRLSFSGDVYGDPVASFSQISLFGGSLISATVESKDSFSRVSATVNITDMSERDVAGLCMYLSFVADIIVDGYYTEF